MFKKFSNKPIYIFLGFWAFWIVLGLLVLVGWIMNLSHLIHMDTIMSGLGAARILGVPLFPLGSLMGWFL